MCKSLVSIIIPCYNGEAYINRSIDSVYQQDWSDIELIVVDDGSIDKSANLIQNWKVKFWEKGWNLIYIYQENAGLGAAINRGLKEVSGKYLTLLDADDRYLDKSVSKKAHYLDEHSEIPLVRSNGWIVNKNNKWPFVWDESEKKNEDVFSMLMEGKTNNWAGSYMLRTDKLFEFYPDREIYPSRYGQNLQLMLPVAYNAKCGFIDETLMEYIQTEKSLSRENDVLMKKRKDIKNAEGYHDIRMHLIEILKATVEEKMYWRKIARKVLNKRKMEIAVENGDKKLLRQSVAEMKSEKMFEVSDKIYYWNYMFKPYAYILRGIRRILNVN